MSIEQAIFDWVDTAWAADTGAGGIAPTASGNARVRFLWRTGEKQPDTPNWPAVVVSVVSSHDDPIGGSSAGTSESATAVLTFTIITDRIPSSLTKQNAVADRLKVLFGKTTPTTALGWSFSRTLRLRGFQGPMTSDRIHWIEQYHVLGTYTYS